MIDKAKEQVPEAAPVSETDARVTSPDQPIEQPKEPPVPKPSNKPAKPRPRRVAEPNPPRAENVIVQETGYVRVRGKMDAKSVFWERDDRHPDGEVWVRGGEVAEVFPTPAVLRSIREGRLRDLD